MREQQRAAGERDGVQRSNEPALAERTARSRRHVEQRREIADVVGRRNRGADALALGRAVAQQRDFAPERVDERKRRKAEHEKRQ